MVTNGYLLTFKNKIGTIHDISRRKIGEVQMITRAFIISNGQHMKNQQ